MKDNKLLNEVISFLMDNEQYGDDWGEHIELLNKQTNNMNKQDKIYNAIENAKTLRNKILWDGLTSDEELSEELQLAFEDVSLAIMELQRISERTQ